MTNKHIAMVLLTLALVVGGFSLMHPEVAHAGAFNRRVYLIHGWSISSAVNCNWGPTFGDIKSYFNAKGYTHTTSVAYYYGDSHCDDGGGFPPSGLHNDPQQTYCANWYDSGENDGTENEDIRHLSCLLAWYFWDHGTAPIAVLAHSMGGLIVRQALADTPYVTAFPPYLNISDVATAGTPHQGLVDDAAGVLQIFSGCPGNCFEVDQMQRDSGFMQDLNSTSFRGGFGRNPQGSGGTDWTTMGSDNDEVLQGCPSDIETLGAPEGLNPDICGMMPGATHFVLYPGPNPNYNHGGYLTDESTTANADEEFSDNHHVTWTSASNSFHSIYTLYNAILLSTW
jgi:hypothetical protein